MTWRVFVGLLDDKGAAEWAHIDERTEDWAVARDRLRAEVTGFIEREEQDANSCADCLGQAREVLAVVDAAKPDEPIGRPGYETIDGEDFVVMRA